MNIYNVVILLLMFVLSFSLTEANEIDSINTNEDVNKFMEKHFADKFKDFTVADTNYIWYYHSKNNSYSLIADSLGMKFWYKADFNNDNRTDLLVYGSYLSSKDSSLKKESILGIIDIGNENYQIIPILSKYGPPFPVVKEINSEYLVLLYKPYLGRIQKDIIELNELNRVMTDYDYSTTHYYADTLVYRFGTFLEFNQTPLQEDIKEIYFENQCGMLECYVMKLTIDDKRNAILIGGKYYSDKLKYMTKLDYFNFRMIFDLIKYINPNKLSEAYSVGFTDASSVTLKITLVDGTIKQIYDYGCVGTLGLQRLYELLFALKDNQQWEKSD